MTQKELEKKTQPPLIDLVPGDKKIWPCYKTDAPQKIIPAEISSEIHTKKPMVIMT
jgi:hypothetical protein